VIGVGSGGFATRDERYFRATYLLFEQILEGLASVVVTRRSGWKTSAGSGDGWALLCVRRGRGVFFDGGAELVEFAVVANVLGSDAFGDGLRALELRGGVEEPALFATVKLKAALGTFAVGIEAGVEDGAAVGAARAGDGADHARSARAELIGIARSTGWRTAIVVMAVTVAILVFLFVTLGIAVSTMAVFAIHCTTSVRLTWRTERNETGGCLPASAAENRLKDWQKRTCSRRAWRRNASAAALPYTTILAREPGKGQVIAERHRMNHTPTWLLSNRITTTG
jgi:hypothetical protein